MNSKLKRLHLRARAAKGRLAQHLQADADAEAIREFVEPLVEAGYCNQDIMHWLNERRVVGPRGGRWHPETVRRLVNRLGLRGQQRAA